MKSEKAELIKLENAVLMESEHAKNNKIKITGINKIRKDWIKWEQAELVKSEEGGIKIRISLIKKEKNEINKIRNRRNY